jgi:DNA modification methylase
MAGQIGLEDTVQQFINHLVAVFDEVRRVLTPDGSLWLNIGDAYTSGGRTWRAPDKKNPVRAMSVRPDTPAGLKPKDLIGLPWRLAFALQEDGWYLRSDVIWCLSGGTMVYAWTQKAAMPMTIKDMARLDPRTVKLWNGKKWAQLLGVSKSPRRGDEVEIVLRSGERISSTPTHRFPTRRGVLDAGAIVVGDVIETATLPEPETVKDCAIDEDAAWLAGLYIAEGSRSGGTIQISGHVKETARVAKLQQVAAKYGGTLAVSQDGNSQYVRLYGKVLNAIIDELVTGKTAKNKGFAPVVWRYSNRFIAALVEGYLAGDGHHDPANNRWRIGFTRNYNLERDLRTACARLGYRLTLNLASVEYEGRRASTFRGELRKERSGHFNEKLMGEVVAIRKARCREVYDLGVAGGPHLFSLASGVLTHNSKPNCMPESVKDRPTRSHEYLFLLTKSERYYYDHRAITEGNGRNRRTVWSVPTQAFHGAHFATFPPRLIEPCILSSSRPGDYVLDPFFGSGTVGVVCQDHGREYVGIELNPEYVDIALGRLTTTVYPVPEVHRVGSG